MLNAGHAAMHETVGRRLSVIAGWEWAPEVSFSVYGERGVIDIFAFHPGRRMLLVIELKTEIVDVQDLIGGVDRKRRLAIGIARERGWHALQVSCWVIVAGSRTNQRRLAAHRTTLRRAFPVDGRTMDGWLADPDRIVAALSFLPDDRRGNVRRGLATPKRVVARRTAAT
jgi:hypothetical protein